MNYKRLFYLSLLLSTSIIIIFLLYLNIDNNKGVNEDFISNNNSIISFDEYDEFFSKFIENIELEDFEFKGSSTVNAIFEPEIAFGKRGMLTLDGSNTPSLCTSNSFMLEDTKKTCQILISVMYTNSYIDRDYLGYNSFVYSDSNSPIYDPSSWVDIFAFENLIISAMTTVSPYHENNNTETEKSYSNLLSSISSALEITYVDIKNNN